MTDFHNEENKNFIKEKLIDMSIMLLIIAVVWGVFCSARFLYSGKSFWGVEEYEIVNFDKKYIKKIENFQ